MQVGVSDMERGNVVKNLLCVILVGAFVAASAVSLADEVDVLLEKLLERGVLTQQDVDEILGEIEKEVTAEQKETEQAQERRSKILPGADTQLSLLDDINLKMGVQYRTMWNYSNLPILGVTTPADTESNDFFRQRMRLNIDMQPADNVGGFLQLEYRGGWGGSSPEHSDPRGAGLGMGVNAFNRLEARGVRYGYMYYTPTDESYLAAGIIPVSDQIGDTLFSAGWDFNVGGVTYSGVAHGLDYRLAYVRLVDGVASSDSAVIDENGDLFIADANWSVGQTGKLGAHVYYLEVDDDVALEAGLPGDVSQGWYALSGSVDLDSAAFNGFVSINSGEFGDDDNTGWAVKAETIVPIASSNLGFMGIYSSGDEEGDSPDDQYRTIQGIVGTEGYWAYTHIFTANPPSDVSGLGVGVDLGGRGLTTLQAKLETPITKKLKNNVYFGWFQASEDNSEGNNDLGVEIGTMFGYELAKHLTLQAGFAYAFLGDYYDSGTRDADNIYELFSMFQLQF
jgi:hypothetical protein